MPPVTPDLASRLENGEIVVQMRSNPDGVPIGMSSGLIAAPPDRVFALMTDFDRYRHFYQGMPKSETRRRDGRNVVAYFMLEFPWPMPRRWTVNEFQVDREGRSFTWKRLDGTVKRYDGMARFSGWPGKRTLMQFEALMDPGFGFLPTWLLSYLTAQSLPGIVSGPRDYLQRTAKAGS